MNNAPQPKHPGPKPKRNIPWTNCPEFFDTAIQMVLEKVRTSLRVESVCEQSPHATFWLFCATNRVTKRNYWHDELLRDLAFGPGVKFNELGRRELDLEWKDFASHYVNAPDQVAKIFLALTEFYNRDPKEWSTRTKMAFLTTLCDEGGRLNSSKLVEWVQKAFGMVITESNCKKAISKERTSRADILDRWKGQIGVAAPDSSYLNLDVIRFVPRAVREPLPVWPNWVTDNQK